MVDQCVSECGNTRCRYNAASQRTADVRMVYMRDRPKMGCEGWQPTKAASKESEKKPAKAAGQSKKRTKRTVKRKSTKRPSKAKETKT